MTCKGIETLLLTSMIATVKCNVLLKCNSGSIQATFSDSFLSQNNIMVQQEEQIHFKDHPSCFSSRIEAGYTVSLYPPYTDCGTRVYHDTDDYLYTNDVVFTTSTTKLILLRLQCTYEDKYLVSAPFGLLPKIRDLNFVTSRGRLSVSMKLYSRRDYHPNSRLGSRPSVLVGVPLYVSVDLQDVFADDSMVTSLQSCYATTNPDFRLTSTNQYLYLITGRCANPDDQSVQIYSNGENTAARFSFKMFRWKQSHKEYIYLHCEVNICNKSAEVCTGSGPLCNGIRRNPARTQRSVVATRQVPEKGGFISLGPIAMATLHTDGKPSYKTNLTVAQDQKSLSIYILGGVFAMLATVALSLVATGALRCHRRNQNRHGTVPSTIAAEDRSSPEPRL